MKILCVGHMKTGTKSLAKALEILGYKVYDFDSQLLHHGKFWFDVLVNGVWPDVRSLYENSEEEIDVLIDMPATFFFEEILQCFPNVKVIFTVRDEDGWVRSAVNQVTSVNAQLGTYHNRIEQLLSPTKREIDAIVKTYLTAFLGSLDPNARAVLRKRYRLHNAHVKAVVPTDKTLIFDVKQGWEPLCKFLSVDVPNQPFPHENKQANLSREEVFMKRPAMMALAEKVRAEKRESQKVLFLIATVSLVLLLAIFICI